MDGGDLETVVPLLPLLASSLADEPYSVGSAPADRLGFAYLIFFILGVGFLLPWNTFITAVDHFAFLYLGTPVDRIFSISYMVPASLPLLVIVLFFPKSSAPFRINTRLTLFTLAFLVVPAMDAVYVKGTSGLYDAFDVTVGLHKVVEQGPLAAGVVHADVAGVLAEAHLRLPGQPSDPVRGGSSVDARTRTANALVDPGASASTQK